MSLYSPVHFFYCLILVECCLLISEVIGEGRVQLKLVRYENQNGKGYNGHCCDGKWSICETNGGCDYYFKICLDEFTGSDIMTNCGIGLRVTSTTASGLKTVDFSTDLPDMENPLDIPFTTWNEGVLIKVEVWDDDYGKNQDDYVDFLKMRLMLNPAPQQQNATWEELTLKSRTTMTVLISAYCDENWYGEGCDVFCAPQNSKSGHYTCSTSGQKICLPGWTGHRCTVNVDNCASGPCRHGTCENVVNGYTCTCMEGFTGTRCDENIDDCQGIQCHGQHSVCTDLIGAYRCDCPGRRTGKHCEILLDPCYSSPCKNNATCRLNALVLSDLSPESELYFSDIRALNNNRSLGSSEFLGNESEAEDAEGYVCDCLPGWEGSDCDMMVDACSSFPCFAGSTCVQEQPGSYSCVCPPGWSGLDCSIDPCYSNPCQNNGTCQNKQIIADIDSSTVETTENIEITTTTADKATTNTISRATAITKTVLSMFTSPTTLQVANKAGKQTSASDSQVSGNSDWSQSTHTAHSTHIDLIHSTEPAMVTADANIEDAFKCMCQSGFTGSYCEEDRSPKDRNKNSSDLFIPLEKIRSEDKGILIYENTPRDRELRDLSEIIVKWISCSLEDFKTAEPRDNERSENCDNTTDENCDTGRDRNGGKARAKRDNKARTNCWNSPTAADKTERIKITYETHQCKSDNRKRTAFLYRVMVGDERLSAQTLDKIVQDIPHNVFPTGLIKQENVKDLLCIESASSQSLIDKKGEKTNMYITVGGAAFLVACITIVLVVVAVKRVRRKVITKEILVPAYSNPLYQTARNGEIILIDEGEHSHLIPPDTETQPTSLSHQPSDSGRSAQVDKNETVTSATQNISDVNPSVNNLIA